MVRGHTGLWPYGEYKERASYAPMVVSDKDDYEYTKWVLLRGNVFGVIDSIARWTRYMSTDPETSFIRGRKDDEPVIRIRRNNHVRHIIRPSYWGHKGDSERCATDLLDLHNLCGYLRHSPMGTGSELLRRSIDDQGWNQHSLPCRECRLDLKEHLIGGRVEQFEDYETGDYRIDRDSAYLSNFGRLPTGTACRQIGEFSKEREGALFTWFGWCEVSYNESSRLSPFAYRDSQRRLHYRTGKQTYRTFLWKEQVDEQERLGSDVKVKFLDGWYWKVSTDDTALWCARMALLRRAAPNERAAKLVKVCYNAAIGGMGIGDTYSGSKGTGPVVDRSGPVSSDYAVSQYIRPTMMHWAGYVHMLVALESYRTARPYAMAGTLKGIMTDEIVIQGKPLTVPKGYRIGRMR